MFETWTGPQKKVAKKLYLWWAFGEVPPGRPAIEKFFALVTYMTVIWNGQVSSLDPIRGGYANECFVFEFWKSQADQQAFWDAIWSELLMD